MFLCQLKQPTYKKEKEKREIRKKRREMEDTVVIFSQRLLINQTNGIQCSYLQLKPVLTSHYDTITFMHEFIYKEETVNHLILLIIEYDDTQTM